MTWLHLDPDRRTLSWEGLETAHLTYQEFRVAELIIGCDGRIASWDWLIAELWPRNEPAEPVNGIKVAIAKVRRKLRDAKMPEVLRTEVRLGFRLADKPANP